MNKKHITRLIIIFFVINTALIGVYVYLFYVTESKNSETSVLYAASHQAASDKEKIQNLERALKDTREDREKLSKYFVTKTSAVTFIEQIEKIGKNAGVDLLVTTVSDDAKDGGAIQISFSATGGFTHMYHLVALVESMPYKVIVKKADIQKISDQQGNWRGSFTVMLESLTASNTDAVPEVSKK